MSRVGGWRNALLGVADLFGKPATLNVNSKQKMSTKIGLALSVIIIGIVLYQGISEGIKMVNREQPQITQLTEYQDTPSSLSIGPFNNWHFGVGITVSGQSTNMSNNSLFSFVITASYYIRNGSTRQRFKYNVILESCKQSDFPTDIFQDSYTSYSLNLAYCPRYVNYTDQTGACSPLQGVTVDKNCLGPPAFDLSGSYLSSDFSFIQAGFAICNKTNSSLIKPPEMQCEELSTINSIFAANQQVKVVLYYANNLINPVTFDTPNKTYLDELYWDVTPLMFKITDIFIDSQTVQDFSSFYSSSSYNSTYYSIDLSKLREQDIILQGNNTSGAEILQWDIRRSNFNYVTTRVYLRIQDIMSSIGGFAKSMMFLFAFIALGYTRYQYNMILSNELYDFEPEESNGPDKPKRKRKPSHSASPSLTDQMLSEEGPANTEGEEEVKDYFNKHVNNKKGLKFGEFIYFKSLFCCCRRKTYDDELAVKATQHVEDDVDLVKILKKITEIEKLKLLVLDRDQRELFDYIPKPVIKNETKRARFKSLDTTRTKHFDQAEENVHLFSSQKDFDSLSQYGKLYISYRNAKANKDPLKQPYNRRLLAMLGPALIRVFQYVDAELGDTTDPDPVKFEAVINRIMEEPENKGPEMVYKAISVGEVNVNEGGMSRNSLDMQNQERILREDMVKSL